MQGLNDVAHLGDERCSFVLQQLVGTFRPGIERMARDRKHVPTLLAGEPRGDERAGAAGRLHHHHAAAEARDDAVAARKVLSARLEARRLLADQATVVPI
jgi:hypothetical protein